MAKKAIYKETDKLLEVADFLFDMQQIEKAEVIYNLVEEKYDDIGIEFKLTEETIDFLKM